MDILNSFIDNNTFPVLTALILGILTSISPCPLATNIAAVAYLSKKLKTARNTLANGFYYAFGRAVSYTLLAILIYYGISAFAISKSAQDWGEKLLGPFLIFLGLAMFGAIKISLPAGGGELEKLKLWFAGKGSLGAFMLGVLFSLAFCPYSALLFFGVLIPLVLKTPGGLMLPPAFALGTALPVIVFSFLIAFSARRIGESLKTTQAIEKFMRYAVALIFICVGIYYLNFLF